ncbi:hypothetical protein [Limnoglobus roseus]|uniref:Uncharacterized protein n=1 Tax=Limnoglobus roseus TaxID=2598579 RepID=A0A5C1ABS9_9BACT|nr:hypothetical protein [Limnoglobus roseus]QEL16711.1 hypothetical protein PX52LOC_03674 [Limnoglobus roseus]
MSVTTACPNGRPRKQLSDQLDRLDGILDVLADALPEAVRDAVRDGTADALRHLVTTALSDPSTLALIRNAMGPSPAGIPSVADARPSRRAAFLTRCRRAACAVQGAVTGLADKAVAAVRAVTGQAKAYATTLAARAQSVRRACHVAWHLKRAGAIAAGVGAAAATVAAASHPVATALSGVGVGLTAFAVQAGLWCRTVARPWRA